MRAPRTLPPRWSAAFWFAVLIGIAVWGKGWQLGPMIAACLITGVAQGLMAVDVISAWRARGRPGLRQWLFITVLIAMAIFLPLTEWWRLYLVTLTPAFAIVLFHLIGVTPRRSDSP